MLEVLQNTVVNVLITTKENTVIKNQVICLINDYE